MYHVRNGFDILQKSYIMMNTRYTHHATHVADTQQHICAATTL